MAIDTAKYMKGKKTERSPPNILSTENSEAHAEIGSNAMFWLPLSTIVRLYLF
jgi:hypothetical protein